MEEELVGSSPPLMAVSPPPVEVGIAEGVETGRAVGIDVEVIDVVDVDPGAAVLLATEEEVLDEVTMTVVVVEEVRPPPGAKTIVVSTGYFKDSGSLLSVVPPSPTEALELAGAGLALTTGRSAPTLELVTAIAKASTARIVGPAGIQFSIPGYCEL